MKRLRQFDFPVPALAQVQLVRFERAGSAANEPLCAAGQATADLACGLDALLAELDGPSAPALDALLALPRSRRAATTA